jgi:integrase
MPPMRSISLVATTRQPLPAGPIQGGLDYVFAHPERGSRLDADWHRGHFKQALEAAGIESRVRTFHDMRHSALTNLALTSEANELVLMATAGHRSFATTKRYLHLAGRVFPDAAQALQDRLNGGYNFVPI